MRTAVSLFAIADRCVRAGVSKTGNPTDGRCVEEIARSRPRRGAPRADFGFRQERAGRFRAGAEQSRRAADLDRRHGQIDRGGRHSSARCVGTDRLSRNHGRAGKDAASVGSRRAARHTRRSRSCRGDGGAWHRGDRPGRRQSLPLRGGSPDRWRLSDDGGEHRHRRPGDDSRGGQEPRLCRRCYGSGRLSLDTKCTRSELRQPDLRVPQKAGGESLCAHRRL